MHSNTWVSILKAHEKYSFRTDYKILPSQKGVRENKTENFKNLKKRKIAKNIRKKNWCEIFWEFFFFYRLSPQFKQFVAQKIVSYVNFLARLDSVFKKISLTIAAHTHANRLCVEASGRVRVCSWNSHTQLSQIVKSRRHIFFHVTHSRLTSMRLSAEHKNRLDTVYMQSITFIHTHIVWKAEMKWNDVRQKEMKKTDRFNIVLDDCLMCTSVNGWAMRIMYEKTKFDVR